MMLDWKPKTDEYGNRYYEADGTGLVIEKADPTWEVRREDEDGRWRWLGPDTPTLKLAKLLAEFIHLGGEPGLHRPRTSSTRRPQTLRGRGGSASNTKWTCSCGERQMGSARDYRDAVVSGWWHVEAAWQEFINQNGETNGQA